MRAVAIATAVCFWLWAWWRSLPPQFHHIVCIVACWFALAVLFAMRLSTGD